MDYLKTIEQRVSTRSYLETIIEKEKISLLINEIEEGNQKYGLSISFLEDGSSAFNSFGKSYGMFKGVRSVIVMKGPKNDIHLKEKLGYVGEKVILRATSLGLATCWVGGSFERENPIFNVSEGEEFVCVITVGIAADKKSLIGSLVNKIKRTKDIEAFYTADSVVPDSYRFDLIDLGIAKLHFELATGGSFSLGNNSEFQK